MLPPGQYGPGTEGPLCSSQDTLQQATSSSSPLLAVFIFDDKGTFISQINDSLNKVDNDYIIKLPFTQTVTNL